MTPTSATLAKSDKTVEPPAAASATLSVGGKSIELPILKGTVGPSVVDMLLARKDERLFTGREVRATVLVCRIRNFSHFIEPLAPDDRRRRVAAVGGTRLLPGC